jgi:hypothetical protein
MARQWVSRYSVPRSEEEQECAGHPHKVAGGLLAIGYLGSPRCHLDDSHRDPRRSPGGLSKYVVGKTGIQGMPNAVAARTTAPTVADRERA